MGIVHGVAVHLDGGRSFMPCIGLHEEVAPDGFVSFLASSVYTQVIEQTGSAVRGHVPSDYKRIVRDNRVGIVVPLLKEPYNAIQGTQSCVRSVA